MPNLENMKKRLTQNYKSSNIYKLLEIASSEISEVRLAIEKIDSWRNLDNAEGIPLDLIGQNVRQSRGQVGDEIYRVLILSKVARNRASGSYNNIIEVLSMALGVPKTQIVIEEGIQGDPQIIRMTEIPLDRMAEIGMSITQLRRIIGKLKAAGIGLKFIEFAGTFEYAGESLESLSEIGLSDDLMETGGTLGDLYQPIVDPDFEL